MKKRKKNYAVVTAASKKMGFAEAPPRANYMEKKRENHKLFWVSSFDQIVVT